MNKAGVSDGILLLHGPASNRYAMLPCWRAASATATSRAEEAVATELVWRSVVVAARLRKFRGLAPNFFWGGGWLPKVTSDHGDHPSPARPANHLRRRAASDLSMEAAPPRCHRSSRRRRRSVRGQCPEGDEISSERPNAVLPPGR